MRKLLSALGATALLLSIGIGSVAAYPTGPDANQASNWNNQFPHPAECFKHEAGEDSDHGTYSEDGKTFTLNAFDQSWPGDHWEAIIVKAGSDESVENPNLVTVHPEAGVAYPAPDGKDISHVIVCKGTTPVETPVPTPVVTPVPTPVVTPVPTPVATPPVINQFAAEPAVCRLDDPTSRIRLRVLAGLLILTDLDLRIDGDLITADDIEFSADGKEAFIAVEPGVHEWSISDGETVLADGEVDCPECFGAVTPTPTPTPTLPPTVTAPPTDTESGDSAGLSGPSLALYLIALSAVAGGMLFVTRKRRDG